MDGIVDFRAFIPNSQCMSSIANLPPELKNYADRYHVSSERMKVLSPDELADRLDSNGVDHTILAGYNTPLEEIAEYVSSNPLRFTGVAGISPVKGVCGAVREIRKSYEMGFRIVGLRPFLDQIKSSDKLYYPLYAACVELGMAVVVHTSFNYGRSLLDFGKPLHLDEVATDFPELIIIASHGGWPWGAEMVAVAWHHENIYIELSSQRPSHMARSGSGWEEIFNYGDGPLRSRLLWGSVSPMLDLNRQVSEIGNLPLSEKTISMMTKKNPRDILNKIGIASF